MSSWGPWGAPTPTSINTSNNGSNNGSSTHRHQSQSQSQSHYPYIGVHDDSHTIDDSHLDDDEEHLLSANHRYYSHHSSSSFSTCCPCPCLCPWWCISLLLSAQKHKYGLLLCGAISLLVLILLLCLYPSSSSSSSASTTTTPTDAMEQQLGNPSEPASTKPTNSHHNNKNNNQATSELNQHSPPGPPRSSPALTRQWIAVFDPNWYFTEQNWWFDLDLQYPAIGRAAQTNTPGAYAKIGFTGTSIALVLNQTNTPRQPYLTLSYSINGHPLVDVQLPLPLDSPTNDSYSLSPATSFSASASGFATLSLATNLSPTSPQHPHTLLFYLKNSVSHYDRWQTPLSVLRVAGLLLDAPSTSLNKLSVVTTVPYPGLFSRRLLVYWDSIGEGTRAKGADRGRDLDRNDATITWAMVAGRTLGMEVSMIGFGAQGWTTWGRGQVPPFYNPHNDTEETTFNKYDARHRRTPEQLRTFARYKNNAQHPHYIRSLFVWEPDVILEGLGTNDQHREAATAAVAAAGVSARIHGFGGAVPLLPEPGGSVAAGSCRTTPTGTYTPPVANNLRLLLGAAVHNVDHNDNHETDPHRDIILPGRLSVPGRPSSPSLSPRSDPMRLPPSPPAMLQPMQQQPPVQQQPVAASPLPQPHPHQLQCTEGDSSAENRVQEGLHAWDPVLRTRIVGWLQAQRALTPHAIIGVCVPFGGFHADVIHAAVQDYQQLHRQRLQQQKPERTTGDDGARGDDSNGDMSDPTADHTVLIELDSSAAFGLNGSGVIGDVPPSRFSSYSHDGVHPSVSRHHQLGEMMAAALTRVLQQVEEQSAEMSNEKETETVVEDGSTAVPQGGGGEPPPPVADRGGSGGGEG